MKCIPMSKPNILLITSDQQHFSTLGCVNPLISTPALDRLAGEGVRFDRAYCPNPTCTPTRASIITGMYPSQHGAWSLGTKLLDNVPTIGQTLSREGYATSLIGKAHFQPVRGSEEFPSIETDTLARDLDYWRKFHGPYYGFAHIELGRMHGDEHHAGQHYGIWMEENGLKDWRDYFQPYASGKHHADFNRKVYWEGPRRWDLPEKFHYSVWTAERTIAQLEQSARAGRPFFCWASFHDPHPPYIVPSPWDAMYDPAKMPIGRLRPGEHDRNPIHFGLTQQADARERLYERFAEDQTIHGFECHLRSEDDMRRDMACYYGMTSLMDREIGRILAAVDRLGIAGDTLVVFTSDHGHFIGQHGLVAKGAFHYEDLIRVPMIVRWPGQVPRGATSSDIQNIVDLSPTFLAAAGVKVPGTMTGLNQLDNWRSGAPGRTWSITENRHTLTKVHLRTYVNARYKITVYRGMDDGELFDLQEDPSEWNNLWHEPSAVALKAHLMQEFLQATFSCEPTPMPRVWGA